MYFRNFNLGEMALKKEKTRLQFSIKFKLIIDINSLPAHFAPIVRQLGLILCVGVLKAGQGGGVTSGAVRGAATTTPAPSPS